MKIVTRLLLVAVVALAGCSGAGSPYIGTWEGNSGKIVFVDGQSGVIYPARKGPYPDKAPFMWETAPDGTIRISVRNGKDVSSSTALPETGGESFVLDGDRFRKIRG